MYEHIVAFFNESLWAIEESKFKVIQGFVRLKQSGGHVSVEDIAAFRRPVAEPMFLAVEEEVEIEAAAQGTTPPPRKGATVAVLPLYGTIMPKANMMTEMSGGTSLDKFSSWFKSALADPNVRAIVIDVDSPGGSVKGVQEMADEIFAARGTKPITAMISGVGASAAYWIASQADKVSITPSGDVGSIGVLASLPDDTKAMEMAGMKVNVLSAGKYKAEGHNGWSEEAKAAMQGRIDAMYETFVRAVARGRGVAPSVVKTGMGQGRVVSATAGIDQGMVDRIEVTQSHLSRALGRSGKGTIAEDATPEVTAVAGPVIPESNPVLSLRKKQLDLL